MQSEKFYQFLDSKLNILNSSSNTVKEVDQSESSERQVSSH